VAISLIAILLVLLIPAIQSARETSRRTQCASNLKNIGSALESYASAHRAYPGGSTWREDLLPYLDERPLADAIFREDSSVSLTEHRVPMFVCPSDPLADVGAMRANYFANFGTGLQKYGYNGFLAPRPEGVDTWGAWGQEHKHGPIRPQDIHDGLSQTAAFSEALVAHVPVDDSDERRGVWLLDNWDLVLPDNLETVKELCLAIRPDPSTPQVGTRGWDVLGQWMPPSGRVIPLSPLSWGYDHALPPNSPACLVGSRYGVLSAASEHPGGVNLLFGDGRVEFASSQIDAPAWLHDGNRSDSMGQH
jgi:prepilin-type processing-associated H-X9-DG protein